MTVISAPNKLNPDTPLDQNLAFINENFNNVVSDIGDLAPEQFGSSTTQTASLVTNFLLFGSFTATSLPTYTGYASMVPQLKIWVDVFDDNHIWPNGSSLTTEQKSLVVNVYPNITTSPTVAIPPKTKLLGSFTYHILNEGASTHTIFFTGSGVIFKQVEGSVLR